MPDEKMPRLTPAGRRVLDAASELFYREGIHSVGVEGIASAAGVTKKTLYDRFGSKDELIAAYLRSRDQRWRAHLTEFVEQAGQAGQHRERPTDKLMAAFDALAHWQQAENPRGCGFANALAELPDAEHPGHVVIAEQKTWMLGYLTELASAAALPHPEATARSLFLLYEGATIAYSTGIPADALELAKTTAATMIGAD